LSLFTDFEEMSTFTPGPQHDAPLTSLFSQLESWSGALATLNEVEPAAA